MENGEWNETLDPPPPTYTKNRAKEQQWRTSQPIMKILNLEAPLILHSLTSPSPSTVQAYRRPSFTEIQLTELESFQNPLFDPRWYDRRRIY